MTHDTPTDHPQSRDRRLEANSNPQNVFQEFDLDAGILCLDFANTLGLRSGEHLQSYTDLIAFALQSNLITRPAADRLQANAQRHVKGAGDVLVRAKRLRAALRGVFSAIAQEQTPQAKYLVQLNRELSSSLRFAQLQPVSPSSVARSVPSLPPTGGAPGSAQSLRLSAMGSAQSPQTSAAGSAHSLQTSATGSAPSRQGSAGDASQSVSSAASVAPQSLPTSATGAADANTAPRYVWSWDTDKLRLDQPIWAIVRSAADLLTSAELLRSVRQCGADDCQWLFLDTSKNRSRQWCSMTSCGNREKARRHYERVRTQRRSSETEAIPSGGRRAPRQPRTRQAPETS